MRHLRSFVVLAQELHFGRAARRLHIVQPALSKQMQLLEEEVGCRLLDRNRRGVALSEAGRLFLAEATQALEHVERAVETARRAGLGQLGRVRIGYSASAVHSGVLADVLARIEKRMPEVEVILERVEPWQQAARLLAKEVDFVIGPRTVEETDDRFRTRCLAEMEVNVALSAKHRLAAFDVVQSSDLKNEHFIEFAESEAEGYAVVARLLGVAPQGVIAKTEALDVLALVQAGRGVCVLPAALSLPAFPQVVYKTLADCPAFQVVVISCPTGGNALLTHLSESILADEIPVGKCARLVEDARRARGTRQPPKRALR